MYELSSINSALTDNPVIHEIEVFSVASGLSIVTLLLCAAVFCFLANLRGWAVIVAVFVLWSLGLFIYAEHDGSATKQAEWNAADKKTEADNEARDTRINQAIDAKYSLQIKSLTDKYNDALKQIDANAKKPAPAVGKVAASCALGADALRLRNGSVTR